MASVETKVPGAVEALIWLISPEQVHEKIPPRKSSECWSIGQSQWRRFTVTRTEWGDSKNSSPKSKVRVSLGWKKRRTWLQLHVMFRVFPYPVHQNGSGDTLCAGARVRLPLAPMFSCQDAFGSLGEVSPDCFRQSWFMTFWKSTSFQRKVICLLHSGNLR